MINVILMKAQEITILPLELCQEFLCKLKCSVYKCENPTWHGASILLDHHQFGMQITPSESCLFRWGTTKERLLWNSKWASATRLITPTRWHKAPIRSWHGTLPSPPTTDVPHVTVIIYKWALISAALVQNFFGLTVMCDDCLINCLRSTDMNRMDGLLINTKRIQSVHLHKSMFFPVFIESTSHSVFSKKQTFKVDACQQ